MAATAAVQWESMKTFDPAGFSKFDIVNDDIFPAQLPASEKQKLRDLNLARSKNNALLALRWRPKPPTSAQFDAVYHSVCSSRLMSSFDVNKTVRLCGSVKPWLT
jgi:hypothetical protein